MPGLLAKMRISVVMLAKKRARTNISFRPKRSAPPPHGAAHDSAEASAVLPTATQKTASASLLAPSSFA